MMNRVCINLFLVIFLASICSRNAYAYIDPGAGSYLLQVFAGFFIGGAFAIKKYWRYLIGYFKRSNTRKTDENGN